MPDDPITNDVEISAILLISKALDSLGDNPRAVRRVVEYVGNRYIEPLTDRLAQLDAEIKVINERIAYKKYGELPKALRDAGYVVVPGVPKPDLDDIAEEISQ